MELMLCKTPCYPNRTLLVQQEFIQQILTELLLKTRDIKLVPVPNSRLKWEKIIKIIVFHVNMIVIGTNRDY